MSLLIKNVKRIVSANDLETIDILIEQGLISQIAKNISIAKNMAVIDGKGCLVTPGLLDIHVHLREPGFTHKETIETGSKATTNLTTNLR
jgi:dihydroorotase